MDWVSYYISLTNYDPDALFTGCLWRQSCNSWPAMGNSLHRGLEEKEFIFLRCLLGREINAKAAVIICCFIGLNYHPVSTETKTLSHE